MRLRFSVNMSRALADRITGTSVCNSVSTALQRAAIAVNDPPRFQNNALSSVPFLGDRSSVVVALAITGETITPQVMRAITAAVVNAVFHSAGQLPLAQGAIDALAPMGSDSTTVSLFGPIGEVKRTVEAGTGYGALGSTNPLYGGTVVSSTDPNARVGEAVPSGLAQAASRASDSLGEYRVPLYIAAGVIGLASVAYVASVVKKVL